FLYEVHLEALADAAVLDIRGIYPIDEINVFRIAGAVNLKTAIAIGCSALEGFLARARSERNDGLERAALRNVIQYGLLHRDRALGHVHDWSCLGDLNGFS